MKLCVNDLSAENRDDTLLKNVVFLVAFISWRQKYDDREERQEDGVCVAVSTFSDGANGSSWGGEKRDKEPLSPVWL